MLFFTDLLSQGVPDGNHVHPKELGRVAETRPSRFLGRQSYPSRPQHSEDVCRYPLFLRFIVLTNQVAKTALDVVVDGIADYHGHVIVRVGHLR